MAIKAYYRLNGNANDDSGGSNNGTNNGAVFGASYGRLGQGAYFDGTAKYIDTPSQNFSYITISLWVKIISTVNQAHIVISKDGYLRGGDGLRGYNLVLDEPTTKIRFEVFNASSSAICEWVYSNLTVWTNIVGTFDGTNIKIYVNGVYKSQLALSGTMLSNTSAIRLGTRNSNTAYSLKGSLDEVKIDNAVWSLAQIKNDYAQVKGFF